MSKPEVYINTFSINELKTCKSCANRDFIECKPAFFEKYLGHIPTYEEAEREGIDIKDNQFDLNNIPKDCPNSYKNVTSRKIR